MNELQKLQQCRDKLRKKAGERVEFGSIQRRRGDKIEVLGFVTLSTIWQHVANKEGVSLGKRRTVPFKIRPRVSTDMKRHLAHPGHDLLVLHPAQYGLEARKYLHLVTRETRAMTVVLMRKASSNFCG